MGHRCLETLLVARCKRVTCTSLSVAARLGSMRGRQNKVNLLASGACQISASRRLAPQLNYATHRTLVRAATKVTLCRGHVMGPQQASFHHYWSRRVSTFANAVNVSCIICALRQQPHDPLEDRSNDSDKSSEVQPSFSDCKGSNFRRLAIVKLSSFETSLL